MECGGFDDLDSTTQDATIAIGAWNLFTSNPGHWLAKLELTVVGCEERYAQDGVFTDAANDEGFCEA
jgi:hypothetical protein